MAKFLKKFFIFSIIFSILILFFEIGGRLYIKAKTSKELGLNLKEKVYGILRSDDELGFSHASHAYNRTRVTNNMGFLNINDVVLPEKRDRADVVFIAYGGSTTYCYNLKQDEAWPNKLQEEMCSKQKNNEPCKFSVFNGGSIMWSVGHIYKKALRDLPIIKPNYLIIYSGINEYANYKHLKSNDKIDVDKSIKNKEYGLTTKAINYWWIRHNSLSEKFVHFYLLYPLQKMIRNITTHDNDENLQYDLDNNEFSIIFDNYIGVLKKLIDLAKKTDTQIIFLAQSQGLDTKKTIYLTSFSQKAKEKMNELGAIVIDSNEILKEYNGDKKELFADSGVHYSYKGSELLSKFLLNKLRDKQILKIN